jgi:hypothetical protein
MTPKQLQQKILTQSRDAFQDYFKNLNTCWQRCIRADRNCSEAGFHNMKALHPNLGSGIYGIYPHYFPYRTSIGTGINTIFINQLPTFHVFREECTILA